MKKSIIALVAMMFIGTGISNGKTTVVISTHDEPQQAHVSWRQQAVQEPNGKHAEPQPQVTKKHKKKVKKAIIPRREITGSTQTLRF